MAREKREKILRSLTDQERARLNFLWEAWGRPDQFAPPGNWDCWLILSGRGWGKTRTMVENYRARVLQGKAMRAAIVGRTAPDVRDTIIEGESGVMNTSPPWFKPKYEPSKRRITWPNGAVATCFSADEPDLLRGPQFDFAICDELAAWKHESAWDNLQFGLRLGHHPQVIVATTPRPTKLIRGLVKDPRTFVTKGSTYDNRANLARTFISRVEAKYAGTRLGRQELFADILEDIQGALWNTLIIDEGRVEESPELLRIVIAVDPSANEGETAQRKRAARNDDPDECGVVACGQGMDMHGYVLEDGSGLMNPSEWAAKAVSMYKFHKADAIVAEANQGGEMVRTVLHTEDPMVPVHLVHASRGKQTRAEPISNLYTQHRIHHVGAFPQLEDQMTTWIPGLKSPDRMDALVWGMTNLFFDEGGEFRILANPDNWEEILGAMGASR